MKSNLACAFEDTMDDSVPKPRYVRCPKCKNVLQEAVDVPFYRCGSCDTVLRAKHWKAGQQNSSPVEPETDDLSGRNLSEDHRSENSIVSGSRESITPGDDPSRRISTETGKEFNSDDGGLDTIGDNLETGGNINGNGEEVMDEEIKSVVGCLENLNLDNEEPEILCSEKTNLEVNVELDENSVGDREEHHLASLKNIGSPAHGGSNSSFDGIADDLAMHPLQQYRQLSKRTFRSLVSSGSSSPNQMEHHSTGPSTAKINDVSEVTGIFNSDRTKHNPENGIPTHERGVSGLSEESYQSSQNSMDSRHNRPFSRQTTFSQNDFASSKLKDFQQGRMELLRKVDELRYQLIEQRSTTYKTTYHLRDSRRSMHHSCARLNGIPESEYELREHHPLARMRSRMQQQQFRPPYLPSSGEFNSYCLHCQALTPREISCNNGLCMSCCRVYCPPPPPPPPPPPYSGGCHYHMVSNSHFSASSNQSHDLLLPMNIPRKVKEQTMKHHCRPVLGGANFVICYECLKLLQIPDDFHASRSRANKLRCGACSEILTFSFPGNNHSKSGDNMGRDYFSGEFSSNMSSTSGGRNPIHAPMNSLDSEGENGRRRQHHPAALHMLMGYYSASDMLYQP